VIDAYEATSGMFRKMVDKLSPDQFPGDPVRAAKAIFEVVNSDRQIHWLILGTDAYRRIGAKLGMIGAEFKAVKDIAFSTDYPDAGKAVL
jgi:hypothetical protein